MYETFLTKKGGRRRERKSLRMKAEYRWSIFPLALHFTSCYPSCDPQLFLASQKLSICNCNLISFHFSFLFLRQDLTVSNLKRSECLCLPSAEITVLCHSPLLLKRNVYAVLLLCSCAILFYNGTSHMLGKQGQSRLAASNSPLTYTAEWHHICISSFLISALLVILCSPFKSQVLYKKGKNTQDLCLLIGTSVLNTHTLKFLQFLLFMGEGALASMSFPG